MTALWTLALVLLAGTVCSASRIVGGSPTTIENYPSIVQVDRMPPGASVWSQACAASILNSFYVLSAAHCFSGRTYTGPHTRRIRSGTTYYESGGVITYLAHVLNHPDYSSYDYDNDIALARLSTGLLFNSNTQPISIINQGFNMPDNVDVQHAGWGAIASGGPSSDVLLDVTIQTVNHDICKERYESSSSYTITDNMICAGVLDEGGKDACQGDSGGPLYYQNILVGIVSWGMGCASPFWPGVNTKVSSYTDWIVANAV